PMHRITANGGRTQVQANSANGVKKRGQTPLEIIHTNGADSSPTNQSAALTVTNRMTPRKSGANEWIAVPNKRLIGKLGKTASYGVTNKLRRPAVAQGAKLTN